MAFRRAAASLHRADFEHHARGIARLNHGSFGSSPLSVQRIEQEFRSRWRANPDAQYFGATLDDGLKAAAAAAAQRMGASGGADAISLVENATVATATIARRWERLLREDGGGGGIMLLSCCYRAVEYSLRAICEPAGGVVHLCPVPFPGTTVDSVLGSLEATLRTVRPRFALLDHVASQPSVLLPIREAVELCWRHGVEEVAVDGAHALGQVPELNVDAIGASFYYTNLHKWAFAASPACAVHCASPDLDASTRHVVPSWHAGGGLGRESRWVGTRDYAGSLAVPAALQYLDDWRSADGLGAVEYNAQGWRDAAASLCEAWEVELPMANEVSAPAMGMLRLPRRLDLSADAPGQPSAGVRAALRERYGIEAAVGGFGEDGGFVRLSHAVYNVDEDFDRLRDAVLDMCDG